MTYSTKFEQSLSLKLDCHYALYTMYYICISVFLLGILVCVH
uniref:Uncharacterized protein n=1 Tax=Arundo donax TaxID=35708 RepID=A0A0A8ZXG1_ARUDO